MTDTMFRWRTRGFAVKADVAGAAITEIEQEHGVCKPEYLVSAAESKSHALHRLFTWDDDKAAGNWRTHEARQIIKSLVTVTFLDDGREAEMPAFVSVGHRSGNAEEAGYRSVSVVLADPDFEAEALDTALRQLQGLRRRYAALSQLTSVWDAIDAVAKVDEAVAA